MIGVKKGLKNFCLRMDMLSAQPILRAKDGDSDYQTMCGGIFSIIIICAFAAIFYNSFLVVINRLEISYSSNLSDDTSSVSSIKKVQFAIGINDIDFSVTPWKFQIKLIQKDIQPAAGAPFFSISTVDLSPCNIADWQNLGKNFDKQFIGLGFSKMLCINSSASYQLYGYSGDLPLKYLTLQITKCTVDPRCDTLANINTYMTSYLTTNNYFKARFFIIDTILSPNKQNPISNIIEKNIMMTYTTTTGTMGYAYISDFTVTTDSSIWPVQQYEDITGTFLDDYTTSTIPLTSTATTLVQFQIFKSTKTFTITRTYGKIDQLLSYVGGLFSLLFTFIAFFFASYSQYSYQLYVGENTFVMDKSRRKFREQDVNFCTYLVYCFYDWLDFLGCAPSNEKMKNIHDVREQANAQLNIVTILRRLSYLQNVSKTVLSQHQQLCLHLAALPTIKQSQKQRLSISYQNFLFQKIEKKISDVKIHTENILKNELTDSQISLKQNLQNQDELQMFEMFKKALYKLKNSNGQMDIKIKQQILPQILNYFQDVKRSQKKSFLNNFPQNTNDSIWAQIAMPTLPQSFNNQTRRQQNSLVQKSFQENISMQIVPTNL